MSYRFNRYYLLASPLAQFTVTLPPAIGALGSILPFSLLNPMKNRYLSFFQYEKIYKQLFSLSLSILNEISFVYVLLGKDFLLILEKGCSVITQFFGELRDSFLKRVRISIRYIHMMRADTEWLYVVFKALGESPKRHIHPGHKQILQMQISAASVI